MSRFAQEEIEASQGLQGIFDCRIETKINVSSSPPIPPPPPLLGIVPNCHHQQQQQPLFSSK